MSTPAVARLSSPGEIVASLPSLCGFRPAESVVVLSLRGPRRRVGLTARLDLPPPAEQHPVAALLAERMAADGAGAVVVVICSETGRRGSLVDAVADACAARDVELQEALHVAADRWTSYRCRERCCPASGTPVSHGTPALQLLEAQRTADGRAVLASRTELVRSVAPPVLLAAAAAQQRWEATAGRWLAHRQSTGPEPSRERTLHHALCLLDQVDAGRSPDPDDLALLAVGVVDVHARDRVAGLLHERSDALLSLLLQVVRVVAPPDDAPCCALLAWVAHARGDGALANVALDRALGSDPDHAMAGLLLEALQRGVTPDEVRSLTVRTPG